jgi:SAM-dependent methyltransferase
MPAMDYSKVAELYDVYVQTELDVPFFLQEAQGCHKVLELTSGTGRLSLPLLQAGVPLTCLDNSPDMLAILHQKLQKQGVSAPLYEMDLSNFSIPEKFDLIIIPFNAFAEITQPVLQQKALTTIHSHLTDTGRLICTLHNPTIRLKNVDGQIHGRGIYALPDKAAPLFLSTFENYEPSSQLVKGAQFYELYTPEGVMQSKRFVNLQFFVHTPETFETLACSQSYQVKALYGDYARSEFSSEKSPFMIWVLHRQ